MQMLKMLFYNRTPSINHVITGGSVKPPNFDPQNYAARGFSGEVDDYVEGGCHGIFDGVIYGRSLIIKQYF